MLASSLSIIVSGMLFALLHSLLASNKFKTGAYKIGLTSQAYRLAYVIIAVLATAAWLGYVHSLPDMLLYKLEGPLRWALHGVQLCGLFLFWLSLRPIDVPAFLGLRRFSENSDTGASSKNIEPFIEKGIYRYLRHPMYSGVLLVLYAMPTQTVNSLIFYGLITVYFLIGSRFEERRMIANHPNYADYQKRVPAFIPWL